MKINKRNIIIGVVIVALIVVAFISFNTLLFYLKVRKLVRTATEALSQNIETNYFTLTHIDKVPIIELKEKPKYYMREYAKHFTPTLKILTSLTRYFFTPKKYKEFQAMTKNNIRHIPKSFRKELRYLAKYSGIHFLKLAELHTFSDYFNYTERFLCSAFAVNNKKSVERKIIVGRNLDYFIPFLKDLTVIHIFEKGKKRYLSIGFLGILGVYSGMNKDGLTISNLLALNPKSIPRNDGIPSSFLYRKILQTSKSAKSAIRMIKNTYKPFANNIVIADAKQVYIVEAYGDIIRVRKFRKGFLFTTNYFLSKDIRSKKHIGMRYKALKKAAKSIKKVDVEIMKNILHRAKLEFMTIHSIIFIPQDKNIYFSYGKIPSTKGPYILLTKLLENKNLNTKSPSF